MAKFQSTRKINLFMRCECLESNIWLDFVEFKFEILLCSKGAWMKVIAPYNCVNNLQP